MHTNQKLLVEEILKLGGTYNCLDVQEEFLEIFLNGKKDFLLDRFSSEVPFHMVKLTADKFWTKNTLISNEIKVPCGSVFTGNRKKEALDFAKNLYPVVLKPNWGSHGDSVYANILDENELELTIFYFLEEKGCDEPFIIEKFFDWKEYRLFITSLNDFAVIHREPASVVGDSKSSIEKLIELENIKRVELKKKIKTSLCPIVLDKEVVKFLKKKNIDLNHVPEKNEKIFLRNQSNLAKGGLAINLTDSINDSVKELAIKILKCFAPLPCAGLDMLCSDINRNSLEYVILEVNSNPGLAMHTYPTSGISVNVANYLMKVMFPKEKYGY